MTFETVALLIITPLTLWYLGKELYGLWSLIFVLSGYMKLTDFGIDQSYVKFISQYNAQKDVLSINKLLSTGFFFYLAIGSLGVLLVYFSIDFILLRIFKIPIEYMTIARISVLLAFATMCLSNAFSCFLGLLNGMQRMELSNSILVTTRAISFIGVLIVIYADWGLVGLTVNACVRILANIILWTFVSIKIFPKVKISVFLISKRIFTQLFNYGYKIQVILIGQLFSVNFVQIILSNILGLTYVAYYTLGRKIARAVIIIPRFLFSALIPAVSDLHTKMKKKFINKIYYKGSKYLSFLTSWFFFCLCTGISYIIYLWLGLRNPEVSYVFYTIVISKGVGIALTGVASPIIRGVGVVEYEMRGSLIQTSLIILLGIAVAKVFGFVGLLVLIFLAEFIHFVYICIVFNKFNNTKPLALIKEITFFPFLLGLSLFAITRLLIFTFGLISTSKIISFAYFIIFSSIFSAIYFGVALLFKYFDKSEIGYIKRKSKLTLSKIKALRYK